MDEGLSEKQRRETFKGLEPVAIWGKALWVARTASAKVLRQECAWHGQRTPKRPMGLTWVEPGGAE